MEKYAEFFADLEQQTNERITKAVKVMIEQMVHDERERCAKVAEADDAKPFALQRFQGIEISAAIRNKD